MTSQYFKLSKQGSQTIESQEASIFYLVAWIEIVKQI